MRRGTESRPVGRYKGSSNRHAFDGDPLTALQDNN